ncbi:hypothetical protein FLACHUCJ7_00220 [Flavobacterium chungangense]|uniref:Uncharacterized protein n=1 Tax=Flavobacterium chungangense TaxID=554283 RepID=A0A6V6YN74_9FLAO|nr:hypothetical protein FLACHUCJ7_00220 [Flavobacterium chungangense]
MELEEYIKTAEGRVKYSLERLGILRILLSSGVDSFDSKSVKKVTTT